MTRILEQNPSIISPYHTIIDGHVVDFCALIEIDRASLILGINYKLKVANTHGPKEEYIKE